MNFAKKHLDGEGTNEDVYYHALQTNRMFSWMPLHSHLNCNDAEAAIDTNQKKHIGVKCAVAR